MMTTPYTNTNSNANAPVAAADDLDCCTAYATSADLCVPCIDLEEARKERQEEESNGQRRKQWEDCLQYAQHRAQKRWRLVFKEETDALSRRLRCTHASAALWRSISCRMRGRRRRALCRVAQLVEECLDDVRERAQKRWWSPLAQRWNSVEGVPLQGVLASAVMQPYLRRWAAANDAAVADAVEAATAP